MVETRRMRRERLLLTAEHDSPGEPHETNLFENNHNNEDGINYDDNNDSNVDSNMDGNNDGVNRKQKLLASTLHV